jgi:hypothetical protein
MQTQPTKTQDIDMALPTINVGGSNLPPEILGQQQQLNRQQQMAQMLMQQGQQMPSGQMVSGRFVAPSFFQYAAPLFQSYVGKELAEKGDKKALDLAQALRKQYADEMENYVKIQRGTPAVEEKTTEMAGPFGEGVGPNNTNIPMPTAYRPAQAAVAPNPMGANLYGSTAYNPVLQQMAAKKLLEGPKWKEVSQFNDKTGNTETYRYDENSTNPRETLQFIGISKPAISPEAQIRFGDEGIGIPPQFRGGAVPVGQPQGQPAGQPQPVVPNAVQTPTTPVAGQPRPAAQPVSAPLAYDPFKPPPVPAGLSGKQARDWKADQNKPLTGDDAKQVTGAINYQKALLDVQGLFDKYKGADLLQPNIRAELQSAVENARLQGKEANRLGALTGPDYGILEKIIADPTAFDAFLKDRTTINKLYNNQRLFTGEMIKTNYRAAQKAVPENLREFVDIKPKELTPDSKDNKPKGAIQVQRAILNGEKIETRNGKWVYSATGKAVE